MRWRALLSGPVLAIFVAGAVCADDLPGQDDERFQAALALWLDNDEATALPDLAALAAEGNRAAQVLLALIDGWTALQGPWLETRSREERIALMRQPGGLSGRPWMLKAAEDTALARLWIAPPDPSQMADTARAFAALGEARAARIVLANLARYRDRGFAVLADDPAYPPDMRYLIWREWTADPSTRPKAEAEVAAAHPGDPQLVRFDFRDIEPTALADWLARAPLAEPLRATCAVLCPADAQSCTEGAFIALGSLAYPVGNHGALTSSGTPSETLIPPEVWNASPRGRAAVLRQGRPAPGVAQQAGVGDTCFADAVATEAARFAR